MTDIFDIEINRLKQNLASITQQLEKLSNERQQLIGAITISERFKVIQKAAEEKKEEEKPKKGRPAKINK